MDHLHIYNSVRKERKDVKKNIHICCKYRTSQGQQKGETMYNHHHHHGILARFESRGWAGTTCANNGHRLQWCTIEDAQVLSQTTKWLSILKTINEVQEIIVYYARTYIRE